MHSPRIPAALAAGTAIRLAAVPATWLNAGTAIRRAGTAIRRAGTAAARPAAGSRR